MFLLPWPVPVGEYAVLGVFADPAKAPLPARNAPANQRGSAYIIVCNMSPGAARERGNSHLTRPPMHFRFKPLGTLYFLALALTGTALHAQDEPKTPLAQKMTAMNTAFKLVGRQIEDASRNASTLEQLTIIETNAKGALTLEPEKKGQVPADEQAKFVAAYQTEMKDFLTLVTKLRTTLKAGNNVEATALFDSLKNQQRDAHKEFRIKKAGAPPGV